MQFNSLSGQMEKETTSIYRELLERQYEINKELTTGVNRIAEISDSMKQLLQNQNVQILENTSAITANTVAVSNIERFWGKIMIILVLALVVLAGAEKILTFIGK